MGTGLPKAQKLIYLIKPLCRIVAKVLFFILLFPSLLYAQTTTTKDDASIVTYDKEYFEAFAPVTLLDMLQRVPGVPEILNQNRQPAGVINTTNNKQERGFGSGGDQILIDGKRLAGKANNIDDTLSRISAAQVTKIELIRGAASGLDVQSQGLVINVVMSQSASTSSTFWKVAGEIKVGQDPGFEALVSHSGSMGKLDYTFTGERTNDRAYYNRDEVFFDALSVRTDERDSDGEYISRGFRLSTNLTYNFEDNAVLRLNGLFEPKKLTGTESRIQTGNSPRYLLWLNERNYDKWEVGGDYSRSLGALGQLKSLFVINRDADVEDIDRFTGTNVPNFQNTRERKSQDRRERIFRASITNGITSSQSLELGGEAAITTFDKSFDLFSRLTPADEFVFQESRSDNVEIQENRYELFANHTYNFSSSFVLQSSLTTEFSKIIADNIFTDGTISRRDTSFTYYKPRVNLRYDIGTQDQIRATAEKKVSQLDFSNFVAQFDQKVEVFRIGNTNIRPEQVWDFSVAYEHRLDNDAGSLEGELFYKRYKDYIAMVDFTDYQNFSGGIISAGDFFALPPTQTLRDAINSSTGSGFISATGNVDKATSYGFKIKSSLRLGFIGLPQATLTTNYTFEKAKVRDQFTFMNRGFDNIPLHSIDTDYRHDITDWGFSYGFRAIFKSDSETTDINYIFPLNPNLNLSVFAEYQIWGGIKMRLDARQLTGKRSDAMRYNYIDHVQFNELRTIEEIHSTILQEFELSFQGTF